MWSKIRRFAVEVYCFFTAPFVVKNCLGMVALVGGIFMLTFWWLKCYTNHGESVQVPSYVGMSLRDAARKARSRNFSVAISDSLYVAGKPPGEVLSQNPKAESRVKEGRTIYFTIAKNTPDEIKLPDLASGDNYDLYSRNLARLGIKTRIAARVANPRFGANTIIAVIYGRDTITDQLSRGFKMEMGGTLDFVVSEQVTLTVEIPDCVCQTLGAAKFLIQTSNLSVGSIVKDPSVTDPENAYVWRQNPNYSPNETMRVGEQIDLYLTQEKPAGCRE